MQSTVNNPFGDSLALDNPILNSDSYKCSQWVQYPPDTRNVFSYVESRGGKYPKTLWVGMQILLKSYLSRRVTQADIEQAEFILALHGEPFNRAGWQYIVDEYDGCLPISIKSAPEGAIIPTHNVLLTIEATDPKCYWLVSYLETAILRAAWYATTVATNDWYTKQVILAALEKSGDPSTIGFKLQDFGARGVSSNESAGIGGFAHSVLFMGSDTLTGVLYGMKYYDAPVSAFSIPASEHSTICAWGREK